MAGWPIGVLNGGSNSGSAVFAMNIKPSVAALIFPMIAKFLQQHPDPG
jgi:hypothetical protein